MKYDKARTYLLTLVGCDHNTMIRHMRHLKQVTTDAYRNNYIDRDPFYDITLTVKKTERFFLSEEELVVLKETEFENKILEEVRDLFLFCCYTGSLYIHPTFSFFLSLKYVNSKFNHHSCYKWFRRG